MIDDIVQLQVDEWVEQRANTDPSLYTPDLDLLAYMLQDLRSLMRSCDAGRAEVVAHQPVEWSVHGLRRRTVVCDPAEVRRSARTCIVGFFADRRDDIDYESIDDLELSLLLEFRNYPGILSYSSVELANDFWANLVVHSVPDDTESWRKSTAHSRAVEVSPRLYSAVRIHNGFLDGGITGSGAIAIECTKYWDYSDGEVWSAIRRFDPPLVRIRRNV